MLLLGFGSGIERTGLDVGGQGKENPKDVSHIWGKGNHRKKELFIRMGGKMEDRFQM